MLDYAAARAVALIVQTGSFEAAARALGVTPSAVSQRVRAIEERLGTVLIRRGQPCTATEAGARLCRHMEQVGMLEDSLRQHLPGFAPGQPHVTLHIATNADSLAAWFLPPLADFAARSGYLTATLVDDQGHTADWLRQGRVLAAVTALEQPVQGCLVRPLGRMRYAATASPGFVAHWFADGVTAEALARAPALSFNHKDQLQRDWAARLVPDLPALPAHVLPSTQGFVEACRLGLGWALHPEALVAQDLRAGRLVALEGPALDVPLFWQVSRLAAGRVSELTRAVVAAARAALVQD